MIDATSYSTISLTFFLFLPIDFYRKAHLDMATRSAFSSVLRPSRTPLQTLFVHSPVRVARIRSSRSYSSNESKSDKSHQQGNSSNSSGKGNSAVKLVSTVSATAAGIGGLAFLHRDQKTSQKDVKGLEYATRAVMEDVSLSSVGLFRCNV